MNKMLNKLKEKYQKTYERERHDLPLDNPNHHKEYMKIVARKAKAEIEKHRKQKKAKKNKEAVVSKEK